MHILHTVLYTFPKVLIREFVLKSRASLVSDHFPNSCDVNVRFRGDTLRRNYLLVTLGVKDLYHTLLIISYSKGVAISINK